MKKAMALLLTLALLNAWIPCASAEISQELDPMLTPEPQATVVSENSTESFNGIAGDTTSNVVSSADAVADEKTVEEPKAKKSKEVKKSSDKKKSKSSAKKSKKSKKTKKSKKAKKAKA